MTNSSDAIDFLSRSVRFLRHWPVHELRGNSDTCSLYYFDRNQVLVRDSNNSDWIYIVLKGSLSVIKKLKRVEAQGNGGIPAKRQKVSSIDFPRRPKGFHRHSFKDSSKTHHSFQRNDQWDSRLNGSPGHFMTNGHARRDSWESLAHLEIHDTPPVYFRNVMELEHRLEQTLPGYHNSVDRLGCLDYDLIIQQHRQRLLLKSPVLGTKRGRESVSNGTLDHLSTSSQISVSSRTSQHATMQPLTNGDLRVQDSPKQPRQRKVGRVVLENPHRASFLPDIAANNKVVRTNGVDINCGAFGGEDWEDGASSLKNNDEDNDADDEDRLSSTSGGVAKEKILNRKRRKISKTSKGVYLAPSQDQDRSDNSRQKPKAPVQPADDLATSIPDADDVSTIVMSCQSSVEDKEESISEKLSKMQLEYHRRVTEGEGRKTIAEELDYRGRREYKFSEADLDPTIIELQVLEKGQYFGLSPLLFPDQPSLSVISNGAECVVISKKFFLRLASEKCLRHLRQTESPYPSDEQLGHKLQEMVNWQAGRSSLYRSLESKIRDKQAKRKQFLPFYQGQYCFRTGPV